MSRRKQQRTLTAVQLNRYTYQQYYDRLLELSMSMFEWVNVPETVDVRFIELGLAKYGHMVFFYDDVLGYLCLNSALGGPLDVYNVPETRNIYTSTGYTKTVTGLDSVIIYNNLLRTNTILDIEMFASRLYDLDRSIDVNARAQKTPALIICDESQRQTLVNVYNEMDGNKPAIFGSKALNKDAITCINTGAPYVADKLYDLKTKYWNEALTYLGISNVQAQKRERMITDEVLRGMGGVFASRHSRLEARRTACKQINTMFGLNIWVNYRELAGDEFEDEDSTSQGPIGDYGVGGALVE